MSIAYTDLTTTGAVAIVHSVARPFIAGDVGTVLGIASGTNFTPGVYVVQSVTTGAATLDRTCATGVGASGVGTLGQPASTSGAGDIQTAGNWTGGLPDFVYDKLSIQNAMTNVANLTLGADGLAGTFQSTITSTGSLTHSGGLLTVACSLATNGGPLIVNQPGNFQWGGASGTKFVIGPNNFIATSGHESRVEFHGTSGSRVTVNKAAAAGNGRFQSYTTNPAWGFGFTAEYTDFSDCGSAAASFGNVMIYADPLTGLSTQKPYLSHCNFIRCGGVILIQCPADIDCVVQNCYEEESIATASSSVSFFLNCTKATTGQRIFQNNGMPHMGVCFAGSVGGFTVQWNVMQSLLHSVTEFTPETVWQGNCFMQKAASTFGVAGGTYTMISALMDPGDGSVTIFGYSASTMTGTITYDNILVQITTDQTLTDGFGPPLTAFGPNVYALRRWINLNGSGGHSSGGVYAMHGTKNYSASIEHVTQHLTPESAGSINVICAADYFGHASCLQDFQDSLIVSPVTLTSPKGLGLLNYANDDANLDTAQATRFTADAGSTTTVLNKSTQAWVTTSGQAFSDAGAVVWCTGSGTSAVAVGEHHAVISNTGTSVTTAAFSAATAGGQFMILVPDQIADGKFRNNGFFNASTGLNWDSAGLNGFQALGVSGMTVTTPANLSTGAVNLGTGNDWLAGGPQFAADEAGYDFMTFDQDVLGFGAGVAWVTSHNYAVGDIVSNPRSDFFNSRVINFYCTVAHTSGASTEPGNNAQGWRNDWCPAVSPRLSRATADGTLYSNPNVPYNGDGGLSGPGSLVANSVTAIEMLHSRARWIKRPRNRLLNFAASDGTTIGALTALIGAIPRTSSSSLNNFASLHSGARL